MLKILFFMAILFIAVRFINRLFLPSRKKTGQFNPFQGFNTSSRDRKNYFDQIEDADYEDLTEKDN